MNITIERVSNGWICRHLYNVERFDPSVCHRANHDEIFVFNDLEDLKGALSDMLNSELPKDTKYECPN